MTEKKNKKVDITAILGAGQPVLMQAVACIFFRRVQVPGTLDGGWRGGKNRPKTTGKTFVAGKSVCISATILTCFQTDKRMQWYATGRPNRGFHRAQAKDS